MPTLQKENSTWIQVPSDVADARVLKRFLDALVEKLDITFGNRDTSPFASSKEFTSTSNTLEGLREDFNKLDLYFVKKNSDNLDEVLRYVDEYTFTDSKDIVSKKYIDDRCDPKTAPTQLASDATLDDVISKVNELINTLKNTNILT